MTGDQLKRWRENRQLTQDDLANYLGGGWTRQKVANVENDRTSMKEDLTAALAVIDAMLGKQPAPNALPARRTSYIDYSSYVHYDLDGRQITPDHAAAQPYGYAFYRVEPLNKHETTGQQLANMYHTKRGKPPLCGMIQLNVETWTLRTVAWHDHPEHVRLLPILNERLAWRRAELAQSPVDNSPSADIFAKQA